MMLALSASRVAAGLRTGTIPESAKARLILIAYVFTFIVGRGSFLWAATWGAILFNALYLGLTIGGFRSCFRVNQEGDGRDFVERYICLGVPISICLYGGYALSYYIAFFFLRSRPGFGPADFASTVRPYFTLASLLVLGLFFAAMRHFLAQVSRGGVSNGVEAVGR